MPNYGLAIEKSGGLASGKSAGLRRVRIGHKNGASGYQAVPPATSAVMLSDPI